MDKIELLRSRRDALKKDGAKVRADIAALVDADSFVELSAFSFSDRDTQSEGTLGEGVVTGFATVGGYPFYIVAQNSEKSCGGLTKANCQKILKTLLQAEKNDTPVIYLLNSLGVSVSEGVEVLEGISGLLLEATRLKGSLMQFAVVGGEVYGSAAALASLCDVVLFTKNGVLATTSPLVLSAKAGKNLKKEEVGGYKALKNAVLPAVSVEDVKAAAEEITKIFELVALPVTDAELNEPVTALNKKTDAAVIVKLLENGVELGANSCPEAKTVIGRIGGIAVAAVVLDNASLNALNLKKIRDFCEFACCYGLPLVTFVDCVAIEQSIAVNDSAVLKQVCEYLAILDTVDVKISVVTGKAVGLAYSLFAAKSLGFDYTVACANAQISLFESAAGAEIEYANDKKTNKAKLEAQYLNEIADPIHAAKGGYIDDIVEPQFLRQYLTASLQTLIR